METVTACFSLWGWVTLKHLASLLGALLNNNNKINKVKPSLLPYFFLLRVKRHLAAAASYFFM